MFILIETKYSNLVLHKLLTGMMKGTSPLGYKFMPLLHSLKCSQSSVCFSKHLLALPSVLTQLTAILSVVIRGLIEGVITSRLHTRCKVSLGTTLYMYSRASNLCLYTKSAYRKHTCSTCPAHFQLAFQSLHTTP